MNITALLPMKAQSERIPNKNMRLFAGKPLYHYIAALLQESELIDTIVINTDSDTIADDAVKHFSKIKIIQRPEKLRGDLVPMNDIIAYDLSMIDTEYFLQTHSTNPLLTRETLHRGVQAYFDMSSKYDSLFSVTKLQTRLYWESGDPLNHNPNELLRTQDLPPVFEENSNMYFFSRQSFLRAGHKRIGLRPKMLEIDKLEAIDIDDEDDFFLAEAVYRIRQEKL